MVFINVISLQSSGEPGQNIADFWVRGIGTFGANSSALVLIDGLEGDLNTIDPADVESFSILKDASATAVYGVRGANGVVLVNTKKGLSGKIQITGRFNTTLSVLNRLPEYLGAYEYAQLANEARAVRNETPLYDDTEMGIIRDGLDPDLYPNVNWQDEILNKTFWRHTYYVSGRGGSDVARYFLSLGGKNESAAYKVDKNSIYSSNVSYNTYNYRINLDVNLTKSTKVYLGSDGFLSQLNQPGVANTEYIWGAQSRLTPLSIPTQYSNGMLPGRGAGELSSPYVMINHTGKAANVTNCSNNYGPYQFPEKLIPLFINNIRHGRPLPVYGKGENVRDWLYVEDHARAIDLIFHKGRIAETYNIGGFNEWKNIDLIKVIVRTVDRLLGNPEGESEKLITYVTDRAGHDLRYAIDSRKLKNELGWEPSLQFEEGIEKTVRWYLENQEWMDHITSGEYEKYYESMYKNR